MGDELLPAPGERGGRGERPGGMRGIRLLAYAGVALAFVQIMFGAIVRITGSGMGCGDHWPTCQGFLIPPLQRPDLIIEVTHRYIAATVTIVILALLATAYAHRHQRGVGGAGGVLRSAAVATGLVLVAAVFGAITVKLSLNPYVIVTHLAIAMTLLAVLSLTALRAGGWGFDGTGVASARTYRSTRVAVALAFVILVFGALTANVPGANVSCQGFPSCRSVLVTGTPLYIQVTHRVLAFLLLFHMIGVVVGVQRRRESPLIRRAAWFGLTAIFGQIIVAAGMVELRLPPGWRSLHQAVGTLVWLALFTLAALSLYSLPERRTAHST
ncbi:MAG: COX15/CtaA family protein [Gemmatimonadota bacterium]|nr:COX15/CtaA family protein [Gemmatimonadota bacterium]